MAKVTFTIADTSYITRKGLISIIDENQKAFIIKEIETADDLPKCLKNSEADYLIINNNLITKSIQKQLSEALTNTQVIVLTDDLNKVKFEAKSIININSPKSEISDIITELVNEVSPEKKSNQSSEISDREKSIIECVALGLTNNQIADKLFISAHTVITHRKNITKKLGIKTVSGLTVYAIINKIIDINDINQE